MKKMSLKGNKKEIKMQKFGGYKEKNMIEEWRIF
jgi:hypothetical protein